MLKRSNCLALLLALTGLQANASAQCVHAIDGQDTFGDGWNGASVALVVNGVGQLNGFSLQNGFQKTGVITATPGDLIDTVFNSGTFDLEIAYDMYGGDGTTSPGFPTSCSLLGGEDGAVAQPTGLTGLVADCSGLGSCPPPPPILPLNDDCGSALDIGGSYQTVVFDMTNATDDGIDYAGFCDFGAFGDETIYTGLWYRFTPDNDGCHYMSTLNMAGFDTRLAVHGPNAACPVDASSVVGCVDDEIQPIAGPFEAGMDVNLQAGQTYLIHLGTFQGTNPMPGSLVIDDGTTGAVPNGDSVENNDPGGVNIANPSGCPAVTAFPQGCNGDGGDGMGCTDCPCGNNAPAMTVGGCLNSAGTSSRLLPTGTPTATGSNMTPPLRFECSGVTPLNSAQLTSGNAAAPANAANPCFGLDSGIQSVSLDGLRCAVQGVLRHGVRPSDANGDVGATTNGWGGSNNLFNYDAFMVGQTKFFQVIHRDDAAAVCQTGQNTTQFVEVLFQS